MPLLLQIRIESARDISEGTLKIVVTLHFDVKFGEETDVPRVRRRDAGQGRARDGAPQDLGG